MTKHPAHTIIAGMTVCLMLASACKTTEENYRQSYLAAVEGRTESAAPTDSISSEIHNKIMEAMRPKQVKVGGMEVPVLETNAWAYDTRHKNVMKKYSVVVGAMRQLFNAKSFCTRLDKAGCPSYIIVDRQKNYYVVAAGFDMLTDAAGYLANIDNEIPFKLPIDKPFICSTTRL